MSLIRKLNDSDYVLLSKKGKVDSCGTKLRDILKTIPKEFYEKNSFMNIITFAPKLIALFLPYIYGFENFTFTVSHYCNSPGIRIS